MRITVLNYELMSFRGNIFFAHKNYLIPFYPIASFLWNLFQKYKTVSFNLRITISPISQSENILSPETSPYDSLKNFDEQTTPDANLIHNLRTTADAHLPFPLSFENSQQTSKEPNIQMNNPQVDDITPATSPLDATSSQNLPNSQTNNPPKVEKISPLSEIDAALSRTPNFSKPRLTS